MFKISRIGVKSAYLNRVSAKSAHLEAAYLKALLYLKDPKALDFFLQTFQRIVGHTCLLSANLSF